MLSYSLSFYLSRSRRDLLPLFFPPMTSAGKIYADLRTIAIPRENEIYRLESLPRCDIYGKEHDKKHANDEQLSRQISSYLFRYRWFQINFQPLQVVPVDKIISRNYFNLNLARVGKRRNSNCARQKTVFLFSHWQIRSFQTSLF